MYEPSAINRIGATGNYDVFRAHVDAGFTEEQAMSIVHALMYSIVVANTIADKGDD